MKTEYNFFITVAGLSKSAGKASLIKQAKKYNVSPFDLFDFENTNISANYSMTISKEESEKSAFTYHSEEFSEYTTDYLGNRMKVEEKSFVHAAPIEFTLSISEDYKLLLGAITDYTPAGGQCNNGATKLRKVSDAICQRRQKRKS